MKAEIIYHDFDDMKCVMFGELAEPSHYEKVAELDVPDEAPETACGRLFERFNIGDHGGLRIRSMSVGDKVRLEGHGTWLCKPVGWERVEENG